MLPDMWSLYALMLKSRLFEGAIHQLWNDGLISGEMHLGTGEEAIIAGVVSQLHPDDAVALDHRGSAAMLMRGIDPVLIIRELLGYSDGLCGGMGGHMHLFSREHLMASSGIVGAEGPTAVGFALASQYLRPEGIAVAFFGEGSINEGMLMESMNLASVWKLPVLFVCKDDNWAVTTPSDKVTGGDLGQRANGFCIPYRKVDGRDVLAVWKAAQESIEMARSGQGPVFLHANCIHLEGHFLGFQLIRVLRAPLREYYKLARPLIQSFLQPGGAALGDRLAGLKTIYGAGVSAARDPRQDLSNDPLSLARTALLSDLPRLNELENQIEREVKRITAFALEDVAS